MPGQYRVVAQGGLRLRAAPTTESSQLAMIPDGTVIDTLGRAWRPARYGGSTGWVADEYLAPAPEGVQLAEGIAGDVTPERVFSLAELWPLVERAAADHAGDDAAECARWMAGIMYQESGFRNYRVHLDGTGHGLAGFDDNGMLPGLEAYSGLEVGRGAGAEIIPVGVQIDYLAYALADYARRLGGWTFAARAWHRGEGGMNDRLGWVYQGLIEAHISTLFG